MRSSGTLPPAVADQLQSAALKDIVVMDLRNDYEWDVGHFVGADRRGRLLCCMGRGCHLSWAARDRVLCCPR